MALPGNLETRYDNGPLNIHLACVSGDKQKSRRAVKKQANETTPFLRQFVFSICFSNYLKLGPWHRLTFALKEYLPPSRALLFLAPTKQANKRMYGYVNDYMNERQRAQKNLARN